MFLKSCRIFCGRLLIEEVFVFVIINGQIYQLVESALVEDKIGDFDKNSLHIIKAGTAKLNIQMTWWDPQHSTLVSSIKKYCSASLEPKFSHLNMLWDWGNNVFFIPEELEYRLQDIRLANVTGNDGYEYHIYHQATYLPSSYFIISDHDESRNGYEKCRLE